MRTLPRVAVVGHVEWVRFARVDHIPRAGEVAHARDPFDEPAGGGAVAAAQLARLAGSALLITALGDDELADRSRRRLAELGVLVAAARRDAPTRSALTLIDDRGERTITTLGARLEPQLDDRLPWERLAEMDAVYFTAGDRGALEAARRARRLVASPRARSALTGKPVLDALVLSARDENELDAARQIKSDARLLVLTEGAAGGSYRSLDGAFGRWHAAPAERPARNPPPDGAGAAATAVPRAAAHNQPDTYGCGDSFAGGLTFALGADMPTEAALRLAARCGASCATGRGPYARQLRGDQL